jgi:hypothetical protein
MKKIETLWATTCVVLLVLLFLATAMVESLWARVPEFVKFGVRNVFRKSDFWSTTSGLEPVEEFWALFVDAFVVWWFAPTYRFIELIVCAITADVRLVSRLIHPEPRLNT